MIRIGYLGPRGTFSQEAVMKYMKDKVGYAPVEFNSIQESISAVQNGSLEEAIVPIENSLEGAVNATMDTLTAETDIKIKDEIIVAVSQNLMIVKGAEIEDIRYIISHPQAIGQCREFISKQYPAAEIVYVHSTAAAAEIVAGGKEKSAAIGSPAAADVYGLRILAPDIQDGDNNKTRFVILSRKDGARTGCDKTSIVFSTEDKPGSLYRILDIFNLWDINMSRIESRPAKNQLGSYIFFIDIEGHREDENVRDALTMVKRKVSFFKFLGSYPRCN